MGEIENLISDLQKQIIKLTEELAIALQDIKDFERLAHIWKKDYAILEAKYRRDIGNAQQTIDQLQKELDEL